MSTVGTTGQPTIFTGSGNTNAGGITPPHSDTLNQSDFLNLLVTQLKNQDPTNPESNTDFAAQMAQFSSLTAINNLSTSMGQFAQFSQMTEGASMIGATVNTSATDSNGNLISGQVTAVTVTNNAVSVTVNGQNVPLTDITSVAPTMVNQPTQSG
jgi:flagellar basal-body rod modification protein FlgD